MRAVSVVSAGRLPATRDTTPPVWSAVAVLIEIHQRKAGAQPIVILSQAPISHFVEAEDALQYPERMLDFGSGARLGRVLGLGFLVHIVLELGAAAGHVLCVWRGLSDGISLPLIASIAPDFALLAM